MPLAICLLNSIAILVRAQVSAQRMRAQEPMTKSFWQAFWIHSRLSASWSWMSLGAIRCMSLRTVSAMRSVSLRSCEEPLQQTHLNGPKPRLKMSPMNSWKQLGQMNDSWSSFRMSAPALLLSKRKQLPQSQNLVPRSVSFLIALIWRTRDWQTSDLNCSGSWRIMWLDSSKVSWTGQQPPKNGLWRDVWSEPRSTRFSGSAPKASQRSTTLPRQPMEMPQPSFLAFLTSLITSGRSLTCFCTHPWSSRFFRAFSLTSAITEMHPRMSPALGWAPLMPPSPELTYTTPFSDDFFRYFLQAFSRVSVVPCTIPWLPMQQQLPAVICPYIVFPSAQCFSYRSFVEQFGIISPLHSTARGAFGWLGCSPCGWPEFSTSVCSSVISLRYFIVRWYQAQFWKTLPLPPQVMSS